MKKTTLKKFSYLGGLLILAAALIPSNLPFIFYIRRLSGNGNGTALKLFSESRDISVLPLSLWGRFFFTFFPFILLLAVLFLVWRVLHGKPALSLITGAKNFRTGLFLRGMGVWLLLSAAADLIQFIFHRENYLFSFNLLEWLNLLTAGFVFILPQIMLEETFFRGYLIKGGTLFTNKPLIPLVIFSLVFGLLHSSNPEVARYGALVMMPQYIGMGLFLAYLSWKTDGLELSMGIHLANNCWGLLIVNSGGTAFETPSPLTMTSWDPLNSLISLAAGIVLFLLFFRQRLFPLVKTEKEYYYNN